MQNDRFKTEFLGPRWIHISFDIINIQHIDCYCVKGLWCCFPIPWWIFISMMGCWCTNTNPLHGSQQSVPLVFLPGTIPLDFYSILLTMITFAFGRVPLISDSSYLKSLTHDNFFHIIIMVVDFFCINFDFFFFGSSLSWASAIASSLRSWKLLDSCS